MSKTLPLSSPGIKSKRTCSSSDLPVVWLPEAVAELQDAKNWYASIRPELGMRFAQAVDETVIAIASTPLHFAALDKGRRRAGVRRFPYGIFFIEEPSRIVVIACFHGKRHQKHWQQREQ